MTHTPGLNVGRSRYRVILVTLDPDSRHVADERQGEPEQGTKAEIFHRLVSDVSVIHYCMDGLPNGHDSVMFDLGGESSSLELSCRRQDEW